MPHGSHNNSLQPTAIPLRGLSAAELKRYAASCRSWHPWPMKVKELVKLVEKDGWKLARTKGSHRQFKHASKAGTVTIAGKASVDVPPGTANNVLKQAGLKNLGT